MSDTVITTANTEPDETVLINALRNQDDIPILMDVVAGQESVSSSLDQGGTEAVAHLSAVVSENLEAKDTADASTINDSPVSQEAHFSMSMDDRIRREHSTSDEDESEDRQALEAAIKSVLEKRLPELITDVLVEYAKFKK